MKSKVVKFLFIGLVFLLSHKSVYGVELINKTIQDNKLNIVYEVESDEKDKFINSIEKEYYEEKEKYTFNNYEIKDQSYIDEINIKDTKEIVSDSNELTEILKQLPVSLDYNENGYIGKNQLNYNEITVEPIYNGYYEEYIDETKQYFDLIRNDMDFIPKEIKKDGLKLYLIKVEWYPQTTKFTGDNEIIDKYRGEAIYRGVKRIDYPYTYKVIANYNGTAKKKIEKPYLINVMYEKDFEKNNLAIPIVVSTTGLFIVILCIFYFKNKIKVYYKEKFVGICNIRKNTIDISKIKKFDHYILKFNKATYKKYKGKTIKVVRNDFTRYIQISDKEIEVEM